MDNIINNYKKKEKKINKILDYKINYLIKFDKENHDIILIYNKDNNELLLTAKYDFIGLYNKKNKTFTWGHNLIKDKRLLKKSKITYQNIMLNKKILNSLPYKINNDEFKIKIKDLENLIKICLYFMKGLWFFPLQINNDLIQFININKFLEKYI